MSFADVGYRFRYMEWAKTVMEAGDRGTIDIGSSGIAPVTLRELRVRLADLELFGPHFYGEPELRRRIARAQGVGEERVLPTLGASHALFLICASLIEPGDEVIVETPGYEVLSTLPRALGARIVALPRPFENRFQFDPGELRRLVTPRTRLVLVTNLHNPSGVALSRPCLAALAECAGGGASLARVHAHRSGGGEATSPPRAGMHRGQAADRSRPPGDGERRAAVLGRGAKGGGQTANRPGPLLDGAQRGRAADRSSPAGDRARRGQAADGAGTARDDGGPDAMRRLGASLDVPNGIWVVVNEVYRDFVFPDPPLAGHDLGPRGVSLGSLTKVYGLGETRIGWAIGDPGLMRRASRVGDFGAVNGPFIAERIGAIALARRVSLLARTRRILKRNRPLLARFLRATPELDPVPPAGGSICFPRLIGVADTAAFARRALETHGVCIVPGEFFGAPGHIRIGIGARDPRRLERGLRRLGKAIRDATA